MVLEGGHRIFSYILYETNSENSIIHVETSDGHLHKNNFDIFQEAFVESLGYFVDKVEDCVVGKYKVTKDEDVLTTFTVTYNFSSKRTSCSCCKFGTVGILRRHILRFSLTVDVQALPECCILKRWMKDAPKDLVLDECVRYKELCCDAVQICEGGFNLIRGLHNSERCSTSR